MSDSRFHTFSQDISTIALPRQFTFPFHYVPHRLCEWAAQEVRSYLATCHQWHEELQRGKMMGVLVVRNQSGKLGFLAAFSGNLGGSNCHDYFVPPVYDLLKPHGEFKQGEAHIALINHRIALLGKSPELMALKTQLQESVKKRDEEMGDYRAMMSQAKKRRENLRSTGELTERQQQELIAESQFQKAELKRLRKRHEDKINEIQDKIDLIQEETIMLKRQRKALSEALQSRIYQLFRVLNAKGEEKNLTEVFQQFYDSRHAPRYEGVRCSIQSPVPPSGAGECCAPKLLQHAFKQRFKPVCMAEFWCGASPVGEIRHDGHFYPACHSKCLPILTFMLQGLDVEPNRLERQLALDIALDILYEDEWIVAVNKPAGMLTVPGKLHDDSLLARLKRYLPQATGPIVVHRLDMATSGIVLAAKSLEVNRLLQAQFATHTVKKRYIALLNGAVPNDSGSVNLPIRPDIDDRPRQVIDYTHGKKAVTSYRVLCRSNGKTRITFSPLTGRTHQLRVHASSPQGLNAPIVGDMLYGQAADRLYLHAEVLGFTHPVSGRRMTITAPSPF